MRLYAAALFAVLAASSASAEGISVKDAYIPETPPGVTSQAAYMILQNNSTQTRSLIGVSAEEYGMVHLHLSQEQGGVAAMSMIHQLEIAPGQTVTLEPGSFHIMLMHPKAMSKVGDTVPLTLDFSDGDTLVIEAEIKARDQGS